MNALKPIHQTVASLCAQGLSSKEISTQVNLGVKTIDNYRVQILHYYHCNNTTQLAHRLLSLNLIQNIYQNEPFTAD